MVASAAEGRSSPVLHGVDHEGRGHRQIPWLPTRPENAPPPTTSSGRCRRRCGQAGRAQALIRRGRQTAAQPARDKIRSASVGLRAEEPRGQQLWRRASAHKHAEARTAGKKPSSPVAERCRHEVRQRSRTPAAAEFRRGDLPCRRGHQHRLPPSSHRQRSACIASSTPGERGLWSRQHHHQQRRLRPARARRWRGASARRAWRQHRLGDALEGNEQAGR